MKSELLGLKEILVGLEEKAGNMELRVREAMDDGELFTEFNILWNLCACMYCSCYINSLIFQVTKKKKKSLCRNGLDFSIRRMS